jgi:hypothetical protein
VQLLLATQQSLGPSHRPLGALQAQKPPPLHVPLQHSAPASQPVDAFLQHVPSMQASPLAQGLPLQVSPAFTRQVPKSQTSPSQQGLLAPQEVP